MNVSKFNKENFLMNNYNSNKNSSGNKTKITANNSI